MRRKAREVEGIRVLRIVAENFFVELDCLAEPTRFMMRQSQLHQLGWMSRSCLGAPGSRLRLLQTAVLEFLTTSTWTEIVASGLRAGIGQSFRHWAKTLVAWQALEIITWGVIDSIYQAGDRFRSLRSVSHTGKPGYAGKCSTAMARITSSGMAPFVASAQRSK